jgi:hypothetical protein
MTGFPGMALAVLIIALGGVTAWNRALLRGASSPRVIEIQPSGAAMVVTANGKRFAVRAVGGIGVTRHWVALAPLSFARGGVMVPTGMLGTASARILRLWALWGRTPGVASGQRPA